MFKDNLVIDDAPAAPALTPDLLGKIRKEDMKQAIAERFRIHVVATAPRTAARSGVRSRYWQAADEEC